MIKGKGFTLLELLIALTVLTVLITAAAPSFTGIIEKSQVKGFNESLTAMIATVKTESVMRNEKVYIHTINITPTATQSNTWCILASTNATETTCSGSSNTLSVISGKEHRGLTISRDRNAAKITITPLNGWPDFSPISDVNYIQYYKDVSKPINVVMRFNGRLRTCGNGGEWYGIQAC